MEISVIQGEKGHPVFPAVLFQALDVGRALSGGAWVQGKREDSFFGPDGLRCYVDQNKIEVCTREVSNGPDLVMAERQIEHIAANVQKILEKMGYDGAKVLLSTEANSGGCHINYYTKSNGLIHKKSRVLESLLAVSIPLLGDGGFAFESLFKFVPAPRTIFRCGGLNDTSFESKTFFGFRDGHCGKAKGNRLHIMAAPFVRSEKSRFVFYTLTEAFVRMIEKNISFPGRLVLTSPEDTLREMSDKSLGAVVDTLDRSTKPVNYLRDWIEFILEQKRLPEHLLKGLRLAHSFVEREYGAGPASGNVDWILKREAVESYLSKETAGKYTLKGLESIASKIEPFLEELLGRKKEERRDPVYNLILRSMTARRAAWPNLTGENGLEMLRPFLDEIGLNEASIVDFFDLRLALFKMIKIEWNTVGGIYDELLKQRVIATRIPKSLLIKPNPRFVIRSEIRAKAIAELYEKYNSNGEMPHSITASWARVVNGVTGEYLSLGKPIYQKGEEPIWKPINQIE